MPLILPEFLLQLILFLSRQKFRFSGVSIFCSETVKLAIGDQFRLDFQWHLGGITLENAANTALATSSPGIHTVSAGGGC